MCLRVRVRSTATSWLVSREAPRVLRRHTARPQSWDAGLANVLPQLDLRWLRLWAPCCPQGPGILSVSIKQS